MPDGRRDNSGGNRDTAHGFASHDFVGLKQLYKVFRRYTMPEWPQAIRGIRHRRSWLINALTELVELQKGHGAAPTNLGRHIIRSAFEDRQPTPESLSHIYEDLSTDECSRLFRLAEPDEVEIDFRSGVPGFGRGARTISFRISSLIGFDTGRNAGSSIVLNEAFLKSLFEDGVCIGKVTTGRRVRIDHLNTIGIVCGAY